MSGGHAKSDINVTPLIDIVLVLLIIFIVMVPGMSKSMPVVVPQVVKMDKPTPPDPKNPPLVVEVDPTADNKAYIFKFQSEAIDLNELANRLTPVVQLQPAGMRKVFVKIDEEVPYPCARSSSRSTRKCPTRLSSMCSIRCARLRPAPRRKPQPNPNGVGWTAATSRSPPR